MTIRSFFIILLFPILANAGAISGGGGKGVAITGANHIELLDLWESANLFGRTLIFPTGNLASDVDSALVALKNSFPFQMGGCAIGSTIGSNQDCFLEMLRQQASKFLTSNPDVKRLHGVTLQLTDDSYEIALPDNCTNKSCLIQIINYQPDNTIWVDEDSFEKMDELNQAALIVHESLYAVLRAWAYETNSIRARRTVGFAFAGNSFLPPQDPVLPGSYVACTSTTKPFAANQSYMYIYLNNQQSIIFAQNLFYGSPLMGSSAPPPSQSFNSSLSHEVYKALVTGKCSSGAGLGITVGRFAGPVEFDRVATYSIDCTRGKPPIVTSTETVPGMAQQILAQYTCFPQRALPSTPKVFCSIDGQE